MVIFIYKIYIYIYVCIGCIYRKSSQRFNFGFYNYGLQNTALRAEL